MEKKKVFVYGSLKKGFGNHRLLAQSELLGTATTTPEFTMLSLGAYPGVVLGGDTAIHGEVYEVDDFTFSRLDGLEGYPNFYNRIELETEHGTAWMYHLNNPRNYERSSVVADGVWQQPKWG